MLLPEENKEEFGRYLLRIERGEFWKNNPSLARWKKYRDEHRDYLIGKSFKLNSDGNYHFKAKFKTNNINKTANSIIHYVIKTAMYFDRTLKQN